MRRGLPSGRAVRLHGDGDCPGSVLLLLLSPHQLFSRLEPRPGVLARGDAWHRVTACRLEEEIYEVGIKNS